MASELILCPGCGITLRPFMKVCPRCGAVREGATVLAPQSAETSDAAASPPPQTEVVPLSAIQQQRIPVDNSKFSAQRNIVFLSPNETVRRFPLMTNAQWMLVAIGAGLLILLIVIAWLLWQRARQDAPPGSANPVVTTQPVTSGSPAVDPSPTPTPFDDQALIEAVKSALMAYNPLGFSRYNFQVKDGVVTLNGEAEHQPEKDGADNVLKLIAGVKSVVNNLKVKPEQQLTSVKVNPAEARLLDDALKRQIQTDEQVKGDQAKLPQPDPQRESERQRREQAAAKEREEEIATRKTAEDKLKREADEFEKRLEADRRAEAERRARAEQSRVEASVLRSGTVAWSGMVDGLDEIIFSGAGASVRHINGNPPREVRTSFSAPIPRSPVSVRLLTISGRGSIQIVQEPSAGNGYTTIVRIDDSSKGGEKKYEFTLRWMLQ